jgi:hypothetical protein
LLGLVYFFCLACFVVFCVCVTVWIPKMLGFTPSELGPRHSGSLPLTVHAGYGTGSAGVELVASCSTFEIPGAESMESMWEWRQPKNGIWVICCI